MRAWAATAALAALSACGGGQTPSPVAPTPAPTPTPATFRTFLYARNGLSGGLFRYLVEPQTGHLSSEVLIPGFRSFLAHRRGAFGWSFGPVTSNFWHAHTYEIAADGGLTETARPARATAESVFSVVATEGFLYFGCTDTAGPNTWICVHQIDASTGAPSGEIGRFARRYQRSGTQGVDALRPSPDGRTLYSAEYEEGAGAFVAAYRIDPDPLGVPQWAVPLPGPVRSMQIDPSGRFLYLLGQQISVVALDRPGGPGLVQAFVPVLPQGSCSCAGLTIDPRGRFLYRTVERGVEPYAIAPDSGLLTASDVLVTPQKPTDPIAIEPGGRIAFLPRAGNVFGYVVDPSTGSLQDAGVMGRGFEVRIVSQPLDR